MKKYCSNIAEGKNILHEQKIYWHISLTVAKFQNPLLAYRKICPSKFMGNKFFRWSVSMYPALQRSKRIARNKQIAQPQVAWDQ